MRALGRVLLVAAVLALLAAIWAPGDWWRWALTAPVLLFVAAALLGQSARGRDGSGGR